jgi:polyribonucleotide 5'-hydroxyl-kinase
VTPLVYYFGHTAPGDNTKLYKQLVSTLASRVMTRLSNDVDARASGIVINTCGWIEGAGYDVLMHCMQAFSVDVVIVMGHDKLYSRIISDAGGGVIVVKLPRSGGVVDRVSS